MAPSIWPGSELSVASVGAEGDAVADVTAEGLLDGVSSDTVGFVEVAEEGAAAAAVEEGSLVVPPRPASFDPMAPTELALGPSASEYSLANTRVNPSSSGVPSGALMGAPEAAGVCEAVGSVFGSEAVGPQPASTEAASSASAVNTVRDTVAFAKAFWPNTRFTTGDLLTCP